MPNYNAPDFGAREYAPRERSESYARPERRDDNYGDAYRGGYGDNRYRDERPVYPPSGFARPEPRREVPPQEERGEKRGMPGFLERLRRMRNDDDDNR